MCFIRFSDTQMHMFLFIDNNFLDANPIGRKNVYKLYRIKSKRMSADEWKSIDDDEKCNETSWSANAIYANKIAKKKDREKYLINMMFNDHIFSVERIQEKNSRWIVAAPVRK